MTSQARTTGNELLSSTNKGPLQGVLVLDLTSHKSGPFGTYYLAAMGATVIKIEALKGDSVRGYAPFIAPDGSMTMWKEDPAAMSLPILNRARGKQSVTLNLKTSEGLRIYKSLVERADVVMENFASGTADRLGIGYEATSAINPRIIYCSISGFGWGEMLNRKAFDVIIQAMSGMMLASGEEGDPPVRIGMSIADSIAPLYAVMGINAALYRREMTGEGEYVDISMLGALTGFLASEEWQALEAVGGKTRTGNFNIRATPFGAFRCRDAHIAIGAGSQDHFACALFRVMGRPEWAEDPNYARNPERSKRNAEVCAAVEEWCGSRTADEVEAALLEVGVPVGKVRTPAESLADPALQARRDITNSVHPDLGPVGGLHTVDLPIRFHKSDYGTGSAAPRLGQHNTAVYRDWLGFSDEELEAWKADQVI